MTIREIIFIKENTNFVNQGFAFESVSAMLNAIVESYNSKFILATTISTNKNSIKLLKKLGLEFKEEVKVNNESLQVYSISIERIR